MRFAILLLTWSIAVGQDAGPVPRELRFDRNGFPLPLGATTRFGTPPPLGGFDSSISWSADGRSFRAADASGIHAFDSRGRWIDTFPIDETGYRMALVRGDWAVKLQNAKGVLFDLAARERWHSFTLPGPLGDVGRSLYSLDLSADRRFLAGIASNSDSPGVAWRYDFAHSRYSRLLPDRAGLQSLRLSPDGKRAYATGGTAEPELTARDVATNKALWTVPLKGVGRLRAVSADGRRLAVIDLGGLTVFDAETGRALMSPRIDSTAVASMWGVDLSPDGSRVALAESRSVVVWNVTTGEIERRLPHAARVVAFSPDGQSLLTGSAWIQRWDLRTGRPQFPEPQLPRPTGAAHVRWSSDGKRLLACWPIEAGGKRSDVLGIWDVPANRLVWKTTLDDAALAIWTDAKGTTARALITPDLVRTWDILDPRTESVAQTSLPLSSPNEATYAFLADGRLALHRLSLGSATFELHDERGKFELRRVRALEAGNNPRRFPQLYRPIHTYLVGPGGWRFDMIVNREVPRLVCLPDARPLTVLPSVSSTFVTARMIDGSAIFGLVWESASGAIVGEVPSELSLGRAVLSKDGRFLASASETGVRMLSLNRPTEGFEIPAANVTAMAFSPDDRLLATAMPDGTILTWEVKRQPLEWPDDDGSLWKELAAADARIAWKAIWRLDDHPAKAREFLAERAHPISRWTDTLRQIARLDHPKYLEREDAMRVLAARGESVEGELLAAMKAPASEEQRARVDQLLARLSPASPPAGETLRLLRAIWLLERLDGRTSLEKLARGAPGARPSVEAAAAIKRLEAIRP